MPYPYSRTGKNQLLNVVPDIREALEESLEKAAYDITWQLKRAGPYWSGFFESLWQVNAGRTAVRPDQVDVMDTPSTPKTRVYSPVEVPESPNLGGYTIGNRANYRLYAMDILPYSTRRGKRYRGDAKNATAPKFWFDTYINTQMRSTINNAFTDVFRRY